MRFKAKRLKTDIILIYIYIYTHKCIHTPPLKSKKKLHIRRNYLLSIIINQCLKPLCCQIFLWKLIHFIFQDSQINRKFRRTAFIKIEIFCNILSLLINLMCHWWMKVFLYFFCITPNFWKLVYHIFQKILCCTTVFNIDNNQKCFLSSKSAY